MMANAQKLIEERKRTLNVISVNQQHAPRNDVEDKQKKIEQLQVNFFFVILYVYFLTVVYSYFLTVLSFQ